MEFDNEENTVEQYKNENKTSFLPPISTKGIYEDQSIQNIDRERKPMSGKTSKQRSRNLSVSSDCSSMGSNRRSPGERITRGKMNKYFTVSSNTSPVNYSTPRSVEKNLVDKSDINDRIQTFMIKTAPIKPPHTLRIVREKPLLVKKKNINRNKKDITEPINNNTCTDNIFRNFDKWSYGHRTGKCRYLSTLDAVSIYHAALEMELIEQGYIWIANQQSIEGEALLAAPQGIIGIRLKEQNSSTLIEDAIELSARAIGKLKDDNLLKSLPPASCNVAAYEWETGNSLYSSLINSSGDTTFDWNGDVLNATYEIVNIKLDDANQKYISHLGTLNDETNINVQDDIIVWPGNLSEKPSGSFVSTFLKIVTVRSKPFVYAIENVTECSKIIDLNSKQKKITYIPCRNGNRTLCCKGYCMELLDKLAKKLNFTYDLHLVEDGQFGSLKKVAGSNVKKWNGMVGEIIEGKADLIVASLTINNERAQYIEFSKPFKYQGITILVKNKSEEPSLASFLRPFKTELWILVLISVHVVAVILYLLDRFSPFGRYRLAQSNKEEDALNLSSAMWFSWGVLLNSGIGEGTPRSFSARVLGMVWAGFAMIIVASYTANLAAFLVLDRPKPVATGIDDPKLRNPDMDSFKYATVTNSSVDAYFRRQVELSTMYTFMTKLNVNNDSDGIQKVKNGELKAFIWDSPVLFHETSNDCDLVTVGDLFGRSGYGIGMPKGSPWSDDISLSVLHFHESGSMEELESTWINFGNCKKTATSATTLGLKHMLGVFIMVAGGIGAGIVIVILEVLYYKHKGWRKQQKKVLKKTTEQWQEHVQDKKNERQNSSRMVHVANGVTSRSVKFNNEKNGNAAERPSSVKFNDRNGHIGLNNPTFDNNNEISA